MLTTLQEALQIMRQFRAEIAALTHQVGELMGRLAQVARKKPHCRSMRQWRRFLQNLGVSVTLSTIVGENARNPHGERRLCLWTVTTAQIVGKRCRSELVTPN